MEPVRVIYSFQKNAEEEVRFTMKEYKERQYLDIRIWFQAANGSELYPTKKGLTLSLEYLPDLKKGLEHVEKETGEMARHRALTPVK